MDNKRRTGFKYEQIACDFLINSGYKILERNFYCSYGEIDVIGFKDGYIVFIEVKSRNKTTSGQAIEAVDCRKQRRIMKSAIYYLYSHGISDDCKIRFDVVAIDNDVIKIYEDAFQC